MGLATYMKYAGIQVVAFLLGIIVIAIGIISFNFISLVICFVAGIVLFIIGGYYRAKAKRHVEHRHEVKVTK